MTTWTLTEIDRLRAERDQAIAERDRARDLCVRLEHALYHLSAWDPGNPVGREMIADDLARGGAASIERPR
jgi:hypothetical protein